MSAAHKPDWWFVGYDHTPHWWFPDGFMSYIDRIVTVYAFDRASATRCCEITPSYEMRCIAHQVQFTKEALESEDWSNISGNIELEVASVGTSEGDAYFHCRSVEKQIETRPQWTHRLGELPDEEDYAGDYQKTSYALSEIWNSNPKF